MLADLHSHTNLSDGTLSPDELVQRAISRELDYLAITDHDSIDAFDQISELPKDCGLSLLSGVEISTLWESHEIHIVGIGLDRKNPSLISLLKDQQQLRRERAEQMDMQLQKAGVCGLMSYLDQQACTAISRNHVADFLIANGVARNKEQAFKRHLNNKGRFGAKAHWCSMAKAIDTIHEAGGISILAHPNRYRMGNKKIRLLVQEFARVNGEAMEVSYSNLDPNGVAHMADIAVLNDLWASTGSDFHTPRNQWMDLGKFRQLPPQCIERAVWHHPRWPGARL
ncbi:MAG: PHP domain-containing protein [Pseudohongiellaceae bacterium]|nr:PHP domain-containing protein [Pseudohongiellaceae bacterium]